MNAIGWIVGGLVVGAGVLVYAVLRVSSEDSRREEAQELARRIVEEGRG
jgi:beta-lactamase class D